MELLEIRFLLLIQILGCPLLLNYGDVTGDKGDSLVHSKPTFNHQLSGCSNIWAKTGWRTYPTLSIHLSKTVLFMMKVVVVMGTRVKKFLGGTSGCSVRTEVTSLTVYRWVMSQYSVRYSDTHYHAAFIYDRILYFRNEVLTIWCRLQRIPDLVVLALKRLCGYGTRQNTCV